MECTSQQLAHFQQSGTSLLERAKQLVDAWVVFWTNAQKVETDGEVGQQACHMEEADLEDAGLVPACDMNTWKSETRNETNHCSPR